MTEAQGARPRASDNDLRAIVGEHAQEISQINGRLDELGKEQHNLMREIVAVRAEGNARAEASVSALSDIRGSVEGLVRQLAEHTGAQKRQNELKEQELRAVKIRGEKIKIWGTVIGIIATLGGMIGGTLLSSQTWDDWAFGSVHFLHRHPHMDDGQQEAGQHDRP